MPIAKHRNRVGQSKHLRHFVRDINARHPFAAQLVQDAHENRHFAFRQSGRRFIQDQDLRMLGQRLGDLHQLLLADAETPDFRVRGNLESDPLQPLGCIVVQLIPLDHAAFRRFRPEENVLAHRHLLYERQFLVNDGDAGFFRIGNVVELFLLAADDDVSAIRAGWIQTAQHFHQR
ncbi:hypothetical protein D3C74_250710 [compost metagenome]